MRAQLAYWRTRLASMPGTLSLPRDRPRPAVQTYRGRTLRVELPTGLPAALRAYSRSRRVTLYTTMYAAFALLLRRCTGQTDVCLGSAFANRQSPQVQDLIGMFVNPVVLRLEVDDRESFDVLAGRAAAAVLDASENQELPFPVLVRELNPGRDVAGNPLVQTLFSANDSPLPELRLGDATGTVFERGNGSAKVDLDVVVVPRAESQVGSDTGHTDDRILLLWEYNADLFDESTMRGLVAAYLHLLADAAVRPDVPVRELELLDEAAARVVAAHDGPAAVGVELPCTGSSPDTPAGARTPRLW
jgi:non-ribosomal peptide synthetase component F